MSNCLKYAFQNKDDGQIKVSLKEDEKQLILQVIDNGVGIPVYRKNTLGTSFGYRLIEVLREQMRGELQIESDTGTTVTLTLEKYQKAQYSQVEMY